MTICKSDEPQRTQRAQRGNFVSRFMVEDLYKNLNWFLCVLCVLCGFTSGCASVRAAPGTADPLNALGWLAGTWMNDDGHTVVEEHWTQPRGGTMFGVNRIVKDGTTVMYEYLC